VPVACTYSRFTGANSHFCAQKKPPSEISQCESGRRLFLSLSMPQNVLYTLAPRSAINICSQCGMPVSKLACVRVDRSFARLARTESHSYGLSCTSKDAIATLPIECAEHGERQEAVICRKNGGRYRIRISGTT
jgi:hypothetical protein